MKIPVNGRRGYLGCCSIGCWKTKGHVAKGVGIYGSMRWLTPAVRGDTFPVRTLKVIGLVGIVPFSGRTSDSISTPLACQGPHITAFSGGNDTRVARELGANFVVTSATAVSVVGSVSQASAAPFRNSHVPRCRLGGSPVGAS